MSELQDQSIRDEVRGGLAAIDAARMAAQADLATVVR